MTEREILHSTFLRFFKYLEEQGELSSIVSSNNFQQLAQILEISPKTLSSYLKSEHCITLLEAYNFCLHFNLNQEEFFNAIPNYVDRIAQENDLTIQTDINAVGGYALSREFSSSVIEFSKIKGLKGGSKIINIIGDSMSPKYNEGDRIAIEKIIDFEDIKDNFIYVLSLDDNSHKIKQVVKYYDKNSAIMGFITKSLNSKYKDESISIDRIDSISRIIRKTSEENKKHINSAEKNRESLKSMIGNRAELKKVINLFRELFPKDNDLIVYQSQHNQIVREYKKGEIEISARDRANSRIISAILDFIDEMKDKDLEAIEDNFFE